jgi:hypothetical protein
MAPKNLWTRRDIIKAGLKTVGLGGLGSCGVLGPLAAKLLAQSESTFPYILTVYCSGGWDQTMVFDNKIGKADIAQEAGAYADVGLGDIPFVSHPNRPSVNDFFSSYGKNAIIVNGLYCQSLSKDLALQSMLGCIPVRYNRPVDWMSYYAYSLNAGAPIPHAVIGAPFMPGDFPTASFNITKNYLEQLGQAIPATESLGSAGETALSTFRGKVFEHSLKRSPAKSRDGDKINALATAFTRSKAAAAAISSAANKVGPQGSDSDFVHHGKLALELFAQGYAQSATIQAGSDNEWATEQSHYQKQNISYETLFFGLNTLLSEALTKGVDKNLILIVMSERGRSPFLTNPVTGKSGTGKSAWPYTSTLLWGKGLTGGKVVGSTDSLLRGIKINPLFGESTGSGDVLLEMGHIMSAIYLNTGVPYKLMAADKEPLAVILQA